MVSSAPGKEGYRSAADADRLTIEKKASPSPWRSQVSQKLSHRETVGHRAPSGLESHSTRSRLSLISPVGL